MLKHATIFLEQHAFICKGLESRQLLPHRQLILNSLLALIIN